MNYNFVMLFEFCFSSTWNLFFLEVFSFFEKVSKSQ